MSQTTQVKLPCPKCKKEFDQGKDLAVHLCEEHEWAALPAAIFGHGAADAAK